MNAALVKKMNQNVEATPALLVFYLGMHERYVVLAQYALDSGLRRCAAGYFDVACCYMRLAVQGRQA